MRIEFKKIEIHNFMSFEDEVFDFSEKDGMTLVQGINNDFPGQTNGAGKSNIFLSLAYTLFGDLPKIKKNENIINRLANPQEMRLVLWLDVDNKSYKIARGISKKASSLEVLKIAKDGSEEDITKSSIAETQKMIEDDILHCDISIFLRTILLTADETYNFYLLKKADKKEFVEKLFDIGVFEEIWKLVHRDVLDLDKEILSKQSYLLGLSKTIDDCQDKSQRHEVEHENRLKLLTESISNAEEKLAEQKKIEVKSNDEVVKKLELAIDKLEEKKSETWNVESSLAEKISKCDLGMHKLESTKSSSQKTISKHSEVLGKLCDDCKTIFSKYYSLDKCLEEIEDADEKIKKLEEAKKKLLEEKSELSKSRSSNEDKIQKARAKLRDLNAEAVEARAALAKLESRVESLKNDLVKTKSEKNPWLEILDETKKKIESGSKEVEALALKRKHLDLAQSIVSQDTLRKFVIKDLVVLLNNKIKTYLTKLGANFYVVFDEDMDYEFMTPSGKCEWGNFSAGERMKTMVATSFAFRDFMAARNGLNANILILDEYFDSAIDALTVESVLNLLKDMSRELKQSIYVITHRKEVSQDMFDQLLVVEKTNGTSHASFI